MKDTFPYKGNIGIMILYSFGVLKQIVAKIRPCKHLRERFQASTLVVGIPVRSAEVASNDLRASTFGRWITSAATPLKLQATTCGCQGYLRGPFSYTYNRRHC